MNNSGFLDECEKCGKTERYEGDFENAGMCNECDGMLTDEWGYIIQTNVYLQKSMVGYVIKRTDGCIRTIYLWRG